MSQRQRDTHRFCQKDTLGPEGFDVATRSPHPVSLAHEFDHMSAISGGEIAAGRAFGIWCAVYLAVAAC